MGGPRLQPEVTTPSKAPGREHRRAPREPIACFVLVEDRDGEGGPTSLIGRAVDLSPMGVGLLLGTKVPVGDSVTVDILIQALQQLRLRATGTVVHVRPAGEQFRLGVRFEHPPALVDSTPEEEAG